MHGDKYELWVDGMSFSHMYALNWAKNAFGTEPSYSGGGRYDDTYNDPPEYQSKPEGSGADPFGWDKPNSPPKPKPIGQFYGGDGDGWNDVKNAKHDAFNEEYKKPVAWDDS